MQKVPRFRVVSLLATLHSASNPIACRAARRAGRAPVRWSGALGASCTRSWVKTVTKASFPTNDARRDLCPLSRTDGLSARRASGIAARPRSAAVQHFKRLQKRPTRSNVRGDTNPGRPRTPGIRLARGAIYEAGMHATRALRLSRRQQWQWWRFSSQMTPLVTIIK